MAVVSNYSAVPAELTTQPIPTDSPQYSGPDPEKLKAYVVSWKRQLKNFRLEKRNIWNECWQLYRGKEDWSDKEEWQSKLVLPKAWSSVKQATNTIKRLLRMSGKPWTVEAINPDDMVATLRASQMTDLTQVFLENAKYQEEFAEGLECGFIQGLGVWKLWWGYKPRTVTEVRTTPQFDPRMGAVVPTKQMVQQERLEGQLFVRAVDPYNFYWLPGSKLNKWVGTIEEIEMPKWELLKLARAGVFDYERVKALMPLKIDPIDVQSNMRFDEGARLQQAPNAASGVIKLTEYYGPCIIDDELVEEHCHIVLANDKDVLVYQPNPLWTKTPPYIGFSPLALPFRTEGMGLVEMVREVNKALNRLANLSVDTLVYRLLPVFEVTPEVYENAEDFETGLTPGKIFRRNLSALGQPGIVPIEFQDISAGAIQVSAQLDRSHQEGSLTSEIQQALPRYRGAQSATEVDIKNNNQESFMGSMAADIERQALEPMVEMALNLIFQFLDTSTDPRVASILGLNASVLAGMSREEIMELVQGDYTVKVRGLSGQLEKMDMLQNLVQFMNLIGQNPEAWLPYINQQKLLHRILEAFRPTIHDIDDIVVDAETAAAREVAQQTRNMTPEMMAMLPQLVAQAAAVKQQEFDNMMAQRQQAMAEQQAKAEKEAEAKSSKEDSD